MAIDTSELVYRGAYRVTSRNLLVACYAGRGNFIGIREKLGSRYLFTEQGTVSQVGELLAVAPLAIRMMEAVGQTYCEYCGALARWEPDEPGARRGTWFCDSGCEDLEGKGVLPARIPNRPLYRFLEDLEEEQGIRESLI
jgi:hypothetical protein